MRHPKVVALDCLADSDEVLISDGNVTCLCSGEKPGG